MKKAILNMLPLLLLVVACTKDGDEPSENTVPAKYLMKREVKGSNFTETDSLGYTSGVSRKLSFYKASAIGYNPNPYAFSSTVELLYTGNRLSGFKGATRTDQLQYDANGRLIKLIGNVTDDTLGIWYDSLSYNAAGNPDHIYSKILSRSGIYIREDVTCIWDNKGNLLEFTRNGPAENPYFTKDQYTYDESPNPFYNTGAVAIWFLNNEKQLASRNNVVKRKYFDNNSVTYDYTYVYTYDEKGFPVSANVSSFNDVFGEVKTTVAYSYLPE